MFLTPGVGRCLSTLVSSAPVAFAWREQKRAPLSNFVFRSVRGTRIQPASQTRPSRTQPFTLAVNCRLEPLWKLVTKTHGIVLGIDVLDDASGSPCPLLLRLLPR